MSGDPTSAWDKKKKKTKLSNGVSTNSVMSGDPTSAWDKKQKSQPMVPLFKLFFVKKSKYPRREFPCASMRNKDVASPTRTFSELGKKKKEKRRCKSRADSQNWGKRKKDVQR